MKNKNAHYEHNNRLRRVAVQDARYNLIDAIHAGYKTVDGKLNFLLDADNYIYSLSESGGNPHTWDKLLLRAKRHGANRELRALKSAYLHEQKVMRHHDNEGEDDYTRESEGLDQ